VIDPADAELPLVAVALVEVTAMEYVVPVARPVTVRGDPAPVAVNEPGVVVAVYDVGVPPVAAAVKETVAAPLL
jgi:hypothetical protein